MNYSTKKKIYNSFRLTSYIVSIFFHPVTMPSIFIIALFIGAPIALLPIKTINSFYELFKIYFLATSVMPILILVLFILLKDYQIKLSNLLLKNKKERTIPYLLTGIYFAFISNLFSQTTIFNINIVKFILMMSIGQLILGIASFKYKFSAHATAIYGTISMLSVIQVKILDSKLVPIISILILIAGIVLSSRLFLKAHNYFEITIGILIGLFLGILYHFMI